jgi:hypothetical protein
VKLKIVGLLALIVLLALVSLASQAWADNPPVDGNVTVSIGIQGNNVNTGIDISGNTTETGIVVNGNSNTSAIGIVGNDSDTAIGILGNDTTNDVGIVGNNTHNSFDISGPDSTTLINGNVPYGPPQGNGPYAWITNPNGTMSWLPVSMTQVLDNINQLFTELGTHSDTLNELNGNLNLVIQATAKLIKQIDFQGGIDASTQSAIQSLQTALTGLQTDISKYESFTDERVSGVSDALRVLTAELNTYRAAVNAEVSNLQADLVSETAQVNTNFSAVQSALNAQSRQVGNNTAAINTILDAPKDPPPHNYNGLVVALAVMVGCLMVAVCGVSYRLIRKRH